MNKIAMYTKTAVLANLLAKGLKGVPNMSLGTALNVGFSADAAKTSYKENNENSARF